ncbi:imidazoleglycerol-phosphate dehydratase HisB [Candidatus Palauibacter sp.]|uniref:imidazoleglycerol-phosphate dehydratase HisB n=1 Tax=Candidatus Palauibacter sp. TaxID=3101350 RepID=UPI003B521722
MDSHDRETSRDGRRTAKRSRRTLETVIEARLNLDMRGPSHVKSGLPFLDHMIAAAAFHGGLTLDLRARGDLHVDDHHTVEDCGIVLGSLIRDALGERSGIRRFGYAYAPLDEALARAVVDLSGRSSATVDLGLRREMLGSVATENLAHFFTSLAASARLTLHLDVLRGDNDHHRAEAAFKSFGLALGEAVARRAGVGVPSTKGVLGSEATPDPCTEEDSRERALEPAVR